MKIKLIIIIFGKKKPFSINDTENTQQNIKKSLEILQSKFIKLRARNNMKLH